MKKNKSKLLLPLVVISVLILILGIVLFKDSIFDMFKPADTFTRVEGFPKVVESEFPTSKNRIIAKSEQEFKDAIKIIFGDENKIPVPSIDFDRSNLYIVTTELNNTRGFEFKIRSVNINSDGITYESNLERRKPGKNCAFETVKNVALDIAIIDKKITEIEENRIDKIVDCE